MDAKSDMRRMLNNRRAGFSLEQRFYTDPDFYRLDLEHIWYRDWLFVGHDCELPTPGSFFTVQIGAYPIVILRDKDGEIRAFHNSCRHRGSRVCNTARGSSARLVCPYHQWTYDLDGSLVFARQMGEDFDPSGYSLKPAACESAGGYIFVCLSEEPADFTSFKAFMEPYFLPHGLRDAKIAHESTIVEKGNWKLVWENNRECYHCSGSHPELCRTFSEAPTVTGVDGVDDNPDIVSFWQACEAKNLPARFRIDDAGQYRVTRAPLVGEAVSFTMTGKPAVQRGLSESVSIERPGTLLMYHYPSIWNHVLQDHAVTFRVLPLGPDETAVTTKWLVRRDAVEGVDYDLDNLIKVWTHTNDQDRRIVEENAFGVRSPAYQPGPYSPIHEGGVIQFVDWYADFMERRLSGGDSASLQVVA